MLTSPSTDSNPCAFDLIAAKRKVPTTDGSDARNVANKSSEGATATMAAATQNAQKTVPVVSEPKVAAVVAAGPSLFAEYDSD